MSKTLLCFTAVAVLWAAPVTYAQQSPVRADSGSVAIGGSVRDSTITIGITSEQLASIIRDKEKLSASQEEKIEQLQDKLKLNQRQVQAAFDILGERDIPPERLAAKLVEIAERFKALQATAVAQPGDDPKVSSLKAEAQKAITAGDLAKADELLAEVEKIQTEALDRLALNAAETSAQRGQVALTRLRYLDAAQHFATAASRMPSGHEDKRLVYLEQEADALYQQGDEFGDNRAASIAIERRRQLIAMTPRDQFPLEWARTQNNLGVALTSL